MNVVVRLPVAGELDPPLLEDARLHVLDHPQEASQQVFAGVLAQAALGRFLNGFC